MLENLAGARRESARGKGARSIQNPGSTRCIPAHVWVLCTKHNLILVIRLHIYFPRYLDQNISNLKDIDK